MKVLLVKMSSFGDVLHTLPAVEDAYRAQKITFDWAVEPSFSQIAALSQAVDKTIAVPLREMRQQTWRAIQSGELKSTIRQLRAQSYDVIIDAQGLLKSGLVSLVARGKRLGFDKHSIREPLASKFYHKTYSVPKTMHAVERIRSLFAQIFGYDYQSMPLNYGIDKAVLPKQSAPKKSLLFLHGTTWPTKHWPQIYWQELAQIAHHQGYHVLLPWGNEHEKERALAISGASHAVVLPQMSLLSLAGLMLEVEAVVAVDTGLGHLACALDVPCLSLYGPTDPSRTGTHGNFQAHFASDKSCAPCLKRTCPLKGDFKVMPPCFAQLPPEKVWAFLEPMLSQTLLRGAR